MDIIDILLAKSMTAQGQTDAYVEKANRAAQKAEKAQQDAETAIATVTAAAANIEETQNIITQLLEQAQGIQGGGAIAYTTTGQNEDGYMTQKAVTDALAAKTDNSVLIDYATKDYVTTQIAQIPVSDGQGGTVVVNYGMDKAGHLIVVDDNGEPIASTITENDLITALLNTDNYIIRNTVGLDIDYANRIFTRVQEATNKSIGADFDKYKMYGGRTRCNVADNGTINAFYGDNNYTEDGSNGQVMIYQPKFYYKRIIRTLDTAAQGNIVRHETLILSDEPHQGFKLAPIFEGDLDYVLLPAFDAGLANDKLTSIAGVKPINNITIEQAEAYARARGLGWHIMNMAAESANQMLEMVEFGTMNGQNAIEQGITYEPSGSSNNCYFITGSTATLGNATGHAAFTQVDINGNIQNLVDNGYRAINYRGMENPWGNFWSMIGGVNVTGNGSQEGGIIYICNDFNYTPASTGNNYTSTGLALPKIYGWINAMGYGDADFDWIYVPAECSQNANSFLPVGDTVWTIANLNGTISLVTGGSYRFKEECGPFCYGADRMSNETARFNYGAKLLFIPTKNEIYNANITKWNTYMGE